VVLVICYRLFTHRLYHSIEEEEEEEEEEKKKKKKIQVF